MLGCVDFEDASLLRANFVGARAERAVFSGAKMGGADLSGSPLDPVDPSFRDLPGRLKFMVRRHKVNKEFLSGAAV